MKKTAAVSVIAFLFAGAAGADNGHWHGDIQHFEQYDAARWHNGYWINSAHSGRSGWWWVVDADWYFYPEPVYPNPNPYIPYTVIAQAPAANQYWYCQNPQGYYPYVPACAAQWQPMPMAATSQVAPAQAAASPVDQVPPKARHADNLRDQDDRQLNAFAGEFFDITPVQKGALKHIRSLKARVDAFHQTLFERHYNAMDILKDTEDLQKRIGAKEAEFMGKQAVPSNPAGR